MSTKAQVQSVVVTSATSVRYIVLVVICLLTVITIATTYVTPDPIDRDLDDHRDAVTAARAGT